MQLKKAMVKWFEKVLTELYLLPRWSKVITHQGGRYNEITKQALNCVVTYFLAKEAERYGHNIRWSYFPKIALYRAFEKTILCDIRESDIKELCQISNVNLEDFETLVDRAIREKISQEFLDMLKSVPDDAIERKIFRLATKIATALECQELKHEFFDVSQYRRELKGIKKQIAKEASWELRREMRRMCSRKYWKIFRDASSLRNRVRWVKRQNRVDCNVLAHMFETATFAYLLALEEGKDEKYATKAFFVGMFHDFPECYTGDMPSPVKDSIPGLREATEGLENLRMEENVYRKLPRYMANAVKQIMLEESANSEIKPLIKKADYFAASCECKRQLENKHYFVAVLEKDCMKEETPAPFKAAIKDWAVWGRSIIDKNK